MLTDEEKLKLLERMSNTRMQQYVDRSTISIDVNTSSLAKDYARKSRMSFSGLIALALENFLKEVGEWPKSEQEKDIYQLVREASEAGIDVVTLLRKTMRKAVEA